MSALMLELSCRLLFNAVEQGHLMMWPVSVSVLILSFTYFVFSNVSFFFYFTVFWFWVTLMYFLPMIPELGKFLSAGLKKQKRKLT